MFNRFDEIAQRLTFPQFNLENYDILLLYDCVKTLVHLQIQAKNDAATSRVYATITKTVKIWKKSCRIFMKFHDIMTMVQILRHAKMDQK